MIVVKNNKVWTHPRNALPPLEFEDEDLSTEVEAMEVTGLLYKVKYNYKTKEWEGNHNQPIQMWCMGKADKVNIS